ncbi:MAG: polysaccharide pyruvyl transferase family protein [Lentisphaeria bacterium]|nr:polysaccharide pyruvyl transferase family protein [Lentisphaeria bacterium]
MKILLGGVPLGCDNIGDEAIIACVVRLLRTLVPSVRLTVCTRDGENTSRLLGVETVPLYGFPPAPDLPGFASEVAKHDVFIWFGATGLSDYPERTLRLLDIAREAGARTVVWGVGMNSQLNPAFYRAAGKRLVLLRLLSLCSCGLLNWVDIYENFLRDRTRRHISRSLEACELVVLRDGESVKEVEKCGFRRAVTGADTAILQQASSRLPLEPAPDAVRIGFCISAQNAVQDPEGVKKLWNSLLERPNIRIVLIPMNPRTDRALMLKLASGIGHAGRIECLESALPADVQACASQCRVVVSSRLHLLILASNALVPGLGIERGSKIANYLKAFGRTSSGSVDNCDFAVLEREILELAALPAETVRPRMASVMAGMHARLDDASLMLKGVLTGQDR